MPTQEDIEPVRWALAQGALITHSNGVKISRIFLIGETIWVVDQVTERPLHGQARTLKGLLNQAKAFRRYLDKLAKIQKLG